MRAFVAAGARVIADLLIGPSRPVIYTAACAFTELTMPSTPADPASHLLTAARRCYLQQGISGTGMQDVADTAGVARSTLYRYFPSRDALLIATVCQEMARFNEKIRKRLQPYQTAEDLLVEGLLLTLTLLPRNALLRAVFVSEEEARARRVIWNADVIVRFGEELMADVILPAQDAGILRDEVRAELMIEWVYRILLSLLTLPSNWARDERELRATLRALLVPVLLH